VGLFHILRGMGKSPRVVNEGPVPHAYAFLSSNLPIGISADDMGKGYDLVAVVDCPNFERLGSLPKKWLPGVQRLNIDHHASNELYLDVNWVDAQCSSVGEMLLDLAEEEGWPVSPEAATALYVAIITDTDRFTLPHVTGRSFDAAARLIGLGASHGMVAEKLYYGEPLGIARLKGLCLGTLRLAVGGKVGVARLTRQMFQQTGTNAVDTHEFAALPRSLEGVTVGVLLREMDEGQIKVSLRSRLSFNVEAVAGRFGGGGHPQAAGCVIAGTMDEVEEKVLCELARTLEEKQG
jgi:phosphoesterase RecJ-like protein